MFSPKEVTKHESENYVRNNKRKKRKSKNVPKLVRANQDPLTGEITFIQDGDGRARFKFKCWWKDQYIINGRSSNYGASADAYYKMNNGEKFYYVDERTAYQKLIHLALYTWRGRFKTFMILMHEYDFPLWSEHQYNICVYKNCYDNEYEFHKGEKIRPFKFTDVERVARSKNNKHLKVDENYVNMMLYNAK